MKRNLATMDTDMFTPIGRLLQQGMAHGITNDMIFGGLVVGQTALQGKCVAQATQNCVIATRRVTWDGRVFRYSYASGMVEAGRSNKFNVAATTHYAAIITEVGIGSLTCDFDAGEGAASPAANAFVGAHVVIYAAGEGNGPIQQRFVTASSVGDGSGYVTLTFEEPLIRAIDTSDGLAIMKNPYSNVSWDTGEWRGFCGPSGAYHATGSVYVWMQTWGICFIAPGGDGTIGEIAAEQQAVFKADGSIEPHDTNNALTLHQQHAGVLVQNTNTTSATPFLLLQIDR